MGYSFTNHHIGVEEMNILDRYRESDGILIGTLAGNSLLFRILPEMTHFRPLRLLIDILNIEFLSLLVAFLSIQTTGFRVIAVASEQLLFYFILYKYLPKILPSGPKVNEVVKLHSFKLLILTITAVIAIPIQSGVPAIWDADLVTLFNFQELPDFLFFQTFGWVIFGLAMGWLLIAGYVYVTWWRDASIADKIEFMDQSSRQTMTHEQRIEETKNLAKSNWIGVLSRSMGLIVVSGLLTATSFFLGFLVGFATMLFPLPELFIIIAIGIGAVGNVSPQRTSNNLLSIKHRLDNFELRIFNVVRLFQGEPKGMMTALLLITGFTVNLLIVFMSIIAMTGIILIFAVNFKQIPSTILSYPLQIITGFGVLVILTIPGLYGLWFWYRETFRISHFINEWRLAIPDDVPLTPESELPPEVSKPVGNLIIVSSTWIPIGIYYKLSTGIETPNWINILVLSTGILAVYCTYWSIRKTLQKDAQSFSHEDRSIMTGVLIELVWLWLLLGGGLFPELHTFEFDRILMIAGLAFLMYISVDFKYYLEISLDLDSYSTAITGIILGGIFISFAVWRWLKDTDPILYSIAMVGGTILLLLGLFTGILSKYT